MGDKQTLKSYGNGQFEHVVLTFHLTASNRYKVPVRQWRKWSVQARFFFNELYSAMIGSPWIFQAPAVEKMKLNRAQWRTTSWNASWTAADAVMDSLKKTKSEAV